MVSGCSFSAVLAPGGRIALRWPLEVILSCFGPWWQNSPQVASGASFCVVLGSGARIPLRWLLEGHFELFWALVAAWL